MSKGTVSLRLMSLGFFTFFVVLVMALNLNAGSYLLTNLAFLIKSQNYLCLDSSTQSYYPCSAEHICRSESITYEVDRTAPDYIYNWIEELDLVCAPTSLVSLLGASYYIAYGFGIVFI